MPIDEPPVAEMLPFVVVDRHHAAGPGRPAIAAECNKSGGYARIATAASDRLGIDGGATLALRAEPGAVVDVDIACIAAIAAAAAVSSEPAAGGAPAAAIAADALDEQRAGLCRRHVLVIIQADIAASAAGARLSAIAAADGAALIAAIAALPAGALHPDAIGADAGRSD
jgi:hypothetical protein